MKIKSNFISYNTADESLLVPAGGSDFAGLIKGNATFGAIISLLKSEITREALIDAMLECFDAPRETIEKDVDRVLAALRETGALDE